MKQKKTYNSDIDVTLTAEPKQPGEETNGGSTSVTSNAKQGPYLPTGFTQVEGTSLIKWVYNTRQYRKSICVGRSA